MVKVSHRVRTWTESFRDSIDVLRLDTVDDEVAASRDQMAGSHYFNIGLAQAQYMFSL